MNVKCCILSKLFDQWNMYCSINAKKNEYIIKKNAGFYSSNDWFIVKLSKFNIVTHFESVIERGWFGVVDKQLYNYEFNQIQMIKSTFSYTFNFLFDVGLKYGERQLLLLHVGGRNIE